MNIILQKILQEFQGIVNDAKIGLNIASTSTNFRVRKASATSLLRELAGNESALKFSLINAPATIKSKQARLIIEAEACLKYLQNLSNDEQSNISSQKIPQQQQHEEKRPSEFPISNQSFDTHRQFPQKLVECTESSAERVIVQGEGHQIYIINQFGGTMENQNIRAGGNVDASTGAKITVGGDIAGSTLNLGTISGQVTNLLQQLQGSPLQGSTDLAEVLANLQTSIQEESSLPNEKKQEALEAVVTLAEEGKKTPENRKHCTLAINALKGIASTVSDASKLAEVVNTSLPLIKTLLGLP